MLRQSLKTEKTRSIALYKDFAQEFPQVTGITAKELKLLHQQGKEIVLVDVRSLAEIAISIVLGAITLTEFELNIAQYQNKMIVAYCPIGYRSGRYALAKKLQDIKIFNLEGSLLGVMFKENWITFQERLANLMVLIVNGS